jgi:hypothetical protein
MNEESRDSELLELRSYWEPPSSSGSLDRIVLLAYRRRFVRRKKILLFWAPLVGGALIVLLIGVIGGMRIERTSIRRASRELGLTHLGYVPVQRPRITVINRGEHP